MFRGGRYLAEPPEPAELFALGRSCAVAVEILLGLIDSEKR